MPTIGPLEMALVVLIALLIFGPKRLPSLGRSVGEGVRELRTSLTSGEEDEREVDTDAAA